jgi:hypothetical protein
VIEETIQTRTLPDLLPVKKRKNELAELIADFTMDYLGGVIKSLQIAPGTSAKHKQDLVDDLATALAFPGEKEFRTWFLGLPPLTQNILYRLTFDAAVSVAALEKEVQEPLAHKSGHYSSWRPEWAFNEDCKLEFLPINTHYGQAITHVPRFLRTALMPWLAPPPGMSIDECLADTVQTQETEDVPSIRGTWDNSLGIADSFPLLCDVLQDMLENLTEDERNKAIRGFKKKDLGELRASSGFLSFGLGAGLAPDSVDLVARFVLCMKNRKPQRPKDGQDEIRSLVTAFFDKESLYPKNWYASDRNYLEYNVFLDHLSKNPGYYLDNGNALPCSRKVFHEILRGVAQDGHRFDANKLAKYIKRTLQNFSFCDRDLEGTMKMKAETIEADGIIYTANYNDECRPDGILHYYLLLKPVFKAYCYLFAALGLLEITLEMPPLARKYHDKGHPISSYDSLKTIRITEFGRWCLGLTTKRPPKPAREYQAIADRELYLVTVQGNSLERRVYLDKVGQKLGENRWRISPASFIAGCDNQKYIEERIERFKALIDPDPAPHWMSLFDKVQHRAGLFDLVRTDMLVYALPPDRSLTEELLQDPQLKTIAMRAEGKLLVVPAKKQRQFFALLHEHGIAHF